MSQSTALILPAVCTDSAPLPISVASGLRRSHVTRGFTAFLGIFLVPCRAATVSMFSNNFGLAMISLVNCKLFSNQSFDTSCIMGISIFCPVTSLVDNVTALPLLSKTGMRRVPGGKNASSSSHFEYCLNTGNKSSVALPDLNAFQVSVSNSSIVLADIVASGSCLTPWVCIMTNEGIPVTLPTATSPTPVTFAPSGIEATIFGDAWPTTLPTSSVNIPLLFIVQSFPSKNSATFS